MFAITLCASPPLHPTATPYCCVSVSCLTFGDQFFSPPSFLSPPFGSRLSLSACYLLVSLAPCPLAVPFWSPCQSLRLHFYGIKIKNEFWLFCLSSSSSSSLLLFFLCFFFFWFFCFIYIYFYCGIVLVFPIAHSTFYFAILLLPVICFALFFCCFLSFVFFVCCCCCSVFGSFVLHKFAVPIF